MKIIEVLLCFLKNITIFCGSCRETLRSEPCGYDILDTLTHKCTHN